MIKILVKLIVVLISLITSIVCGQNATNVRAKPLKTYEVEGIQVKSYDYDRLETLLKQKNDTVYVYNFWATWCVPCIKELPAFEMLNSKYKHKTFKMVLISLDFPKMVESRLIPYIKEKKLKAEVILLNDPNANAWIEKVHPNWTGAIPATLIVHQDSWEFYERSFDYYQLEAEVKKFIN